MNNFDPEMINNIQRLVASNPQLASLLQKPGLMQKLQQIASNPNDPNVAMQVASDPDIQQIMSIIGGAQGLGGNGAFPNPFGGGMGGLGNSGFGNNNNNLNQNLTNTSKEGGKNMVYINSSAQFNEIVQNTKNKLIACDFYATWCGPCKIISPEFDRLAQFYKNKAIFLKIDVDRVKDLSRSCGIRAMPTFQFYKNGIKVDEFKGASVQKLNQLLETYTYEPPKIRKLPYHFFPIKENNRPVFAKQPPFNKVLTKLEGVNTNITNDNIKLNTNEMSVLKEICDNLNNKSQWMSQTFTDKHFNVLSKALDWESSNVTLILDVIRVLVLHPSVVDYFKNVDNFVVIEKIFRNHGKVDDNSKQSKNNAMLACRIIINMFNKTGLHPLLRSKIGSIGNGLISCMTSEDSKVRLIFDKVLMQCSFVLYNYQERLQRGLEENEKNRNDEGIKKANNAELVKIAALKIRCFSMLAEALSIENDNQNILACLMSLGTLLFRDENVIAFGKSIEFKMVLKQCNKQFGINDNIEQRQNDENENKNDNNNNDSNDTRAPDVSKCIDELLKAMENPKE